MKLFRVSHWVGSLGTHPKVIIELPGTMIENKKDYAAKVKQLWKSGELISARANFFTCSKCRWSSSGVGCEECNPAKHEELLKQKLQQKEKLKIAVEAAREAAGDVTSHLFSRVCICIMLNFWDISTYFDVISNPLISFQAGYRIEY